LCTRSVPCSIREFRFPSGEIQVEVVVDAIKVGAGSSVEFGRRILSGEYFSFETVEDALLRCELSSRSFGGGIEGVIVVAVAIDI
jgi:hypothetical protein